MKLIFGSLCQLASSVFSHVSQDFWKVTWVCQHSFFRNAAHLSALAKLPVMTSSWWRAVIGRIHAAVIDMMGNKLNVGPGEKIKTRLSRSNISSPEIYICTQTYLCLDLHIMRFLSKRQSLDVPAGPGVVRGTCVQQMEAWAAGNEDRPRDVMAALCLGTTSTSHTHALWSCR